MRLAITPILLLVALSRAEEESEQQEQLRQNFDINPEFGIPEDILRANPEFMAGGQGMPGGPQFGSGMKRRGELDPKVHLLSQIQNPSPFAQVSVVFQGYFGKDATKSLLEHQVKQGETQRVLIGFYNHGIMPLELKDIAGALIDESSGEAKYV